MKIEILDTWKSINFLQIKKDKPNIWSIIGCQLDLIKSMQKKTSYDITNSQEYISSIKAKYSEKMVRKLFEISSLNFIEKLSDREKYALQSIVLNCVDFEEMKKKNSLNKENRENKDTITKSFLYKYNKYMYEDKFIHNKKVEYKITLNTYIILDNYNKNFVVSIMNVINTSSNSNLNPNQIDFPNINIISNINNTNNNNNESKQNSNSNTITNNSNSDTHSNSFTENENNINNNIKNYTKIYSGFLEDEYIRNEDKYNFSNQIHGSSSNSKKFNTEIFISNNFTSKFKNFVLNIQEEVSSILHNTLYYDKIDNISYLCRDL